MCDYCSWISQVLDKIDAKAQVRKKRRLAPWVDPVIIIHGGAGNIPRYAQKFMLDEVKEAAITSYCELIKGCSSVDAVERAICHMESKKYFNCAYGGSLDANGEVVMDAAIMTGDFRAGCVGAVRNMAHPITLAKKVLQQTEHVLVVESGAQKLALESNIPILSSEKLIVTSDSKTSLHEEEDSGNKKNNENERDILKALIILIHTLIAIIRSASREEDTGACTDRKRTM
ncbi:isoaspartyl peptidase/L-asparaginase [Ooceraea biroi]|uniref:isoaspartyl peptidase/L-asparaginase n=1 Tax=Ooceraea biroi TaxID=2015173 RepID=UPI0005B8EFC7|nr:isoaspartyl peptidase/L-asparaginase [Ooceraea biroi]